MMNISAIWGIFVVSAVCHIISLIIVFLNIALPIGLH